MVVPPSSSRPPAPSTQDPDESKPGPVSAERSKRAQILAAASQSFLERGFGAASMDEIALRARVSKATVYAHFASKEELFGTIIAERCRTVFEENRPFAADEPDIEGTLKEVGRRFVELLMSAEGLAMYRLVIAESPRFPEIGRQFYEAGPAQLHGQLARYLEDADRRGRLKVESPALAAEQFLGMLKGEPYLKRVLGLEPVAADRLEREIDAAVAVIMKAYRSGG